MSRPPENRPAENRPPEKRAAEDSDGEDRDTDEQDAEQAEIERAEFDRVEDELSTRWPETRLDPTLDRISALVDLLGSPQHAYPVIHIAGTNGKGSTARMVDSLLRAFGLRVGRITSPHLVSVTERITIDGEPISPQRFVSTYDDIEPYLRIADDASIDEGGVAMSYFEVLTAMGYAAFAEAPVDVAVVEVGMGGSWDSTNVADGQVAVVTPIDLDHTRYLGDTVAEIAGEKAGIIKPNATAVFAAQQPDAERVLLERAVQAEATVAREGREFALQGRSVAVGGQLISVRGLSGTVDDIFLPLHGAHQAHNATVAVAAVEAFFGSTADKPIRADLVRQGLAAATSPGRLEVMRSGAGPSVLIDAAHNPHGVTATLAAVAEAFGFSRLVGVVGMLADKDVAGMIRLLEPAMASVVVTQNSSHRALPADALGSVAEDVFGPERVEVEPDLGAAIGRARELADTDDAGVLVIGSVITAGDARALLEA